MREYRRILFLEILALYLEKKNVYDVKRWSTEY